MEKALLEQLRKILAGEAVAWKEDLAGQGIALRPQVFRAAVPEHRHASVELLYMCQGGSRHRIDGAPLTLRAGELLLLNQSVRHQVEAGEECLGVRFLLLPPFFPYAREMAGKSNALAEFLLDGLRKSSGGIGCLHFQTAGCPSVQNLVENLLWNLAFPHQGGSRTALATMGLLLLQLMEELPTLNEPGNSGLVLAALREVEENYRDADLTRLAGQLHVSLPYLSHTIHSSTGRTFKELLLEKRLEQARVLLEETGLPIDGVIDAVGYDNTSYFYRKFRTRYGTSPKDWRKARNRQ